MAGMPRGDASEEGKAAAKWRRRGRKDGERSEESGGEGEVREMQGRQAGRERRWGVREADIVEGNDGSNEGDCIKADPRGKEVGCYMQEEVSIRVEPADVSRLRGGMVRLVR
eukprot:756465-Hanusia_phi.AAC.3